MIHCWHIHYLLSVSTYSHLSNCLLNVITAPGLLHLSAAMTITNLEGHTVISAHALTPTERILTKVVTIPETRLILMTAGIAEDGMTWEMLKRDRQLIC